MSTPSLRNYIEKYKHTILLIELAGLLHDMGKLDSRFIDYRKKWQDNKDGWNYKNDPHDDEKKPFFDNDPLLSNNIFGGFKKILNSNISTLSGYSDIKNNNYQYNLNFPFKDLMHLHTKAGSNHLASFIRLGDMIDSAYDRNNPLLWAEQRDVSGDKPVYKSSVFGHETQLESKRFDSLRKRLYKTLNVLLDKNPSDYNLDTRKKIFAAIEDAFDSAITDTCRPANDIPLWQHAYVTAALTKIFFLHLVIYGESLPKIVFEDMRENFYKAEFTMYSFGWDGLSFISKGHKIGDIIARKEIIRVLKDKIKDLLEYEYLIGTNIYDDDNGITFIIPAIKEEDSKEYIELLFEIENKVKELADEYTDGEIIPVSVKTGESATNGQKYNSKSTHFIMDIFHTLDKLRKKSQIPYDYSKRPSWIECWNNSNDEVCNVCQKRPIITGGKICEVCKKRRTDSQILRDQDQSVFNSEIADENGRLCLLVAKFNLLPWLSGDMVWTLFTKEPHCLKGALAHLGKIKDFENVDLERITKINSYSQDILKPSFNYTCTVIKNHVELCENTTSNSPYENYENFVKGINYLYFLYDREPLRLIDKYLENIKDKWVNRVNNQMEMLNRWGKKTDLTNYLLSKNQTPSRLLNVWNGTKQFFRDVLEKENLKGILLPFRQLIIKFNLNSEPLTNEKLNEYLPLENSCYQAEIAGERVEFIRRGDNIFVINTGYVELDANKKNELWKNLDVVIYSNEFEKNIKETRKGLKVSSIGYGEQYYYPFRTVTISPDLMMVLIPANKAMEVSKYIQREYIKQFGKVFGRLPLFIGNIFFQKEIPMFTVLDAGRKMIDSFNSFWSDYWRDEKKRKFEVKNIDMVKKRVTLKHDAKTITLDVNHSLGDGNPDFYHPYFLFSRGNNNSHKNKQSFMETVIGDVVHFSDLEEGYKLNIYPNIYDFEYLDSSSKRFNLMTDKNYQRQSLVTGINSKPYLLEELGQGLEELWKLLKSLPGITETKLQNIESLLLIKLGEWGKGDQWEKLVEKTLLKEFPIFRDSSKLNHLGDYEFLKKSILSGLFFDCLELYKSIFKKKISDKEEEV